VDSADRDRIGISKDELILMLQVSNAFVVNNFTVCILLLNKKMYFFHFMLNINSHFLNNIIQNVDV